MISTLLSRSTCTNCKICCKYTDRDIWDAPSFSCEEFEKVQARTQASSFMERNLHFFQMKKDEHGEYKCPFLSEFGCILKQDKPFKCAIWPLYVVFLDERIALAVSSECPTVYQLSNTEIIEKLGDIISRIRLTVKLNPDLIEPYRTHFRFLCFLDKD